MRIPGSGMEKIRIGDLGWKKFRSGINIPDPQPVLRIHDILVWIRIWIRGSMPLTNGSGSGSFYFIIDFQDANKKLI